MMKHLCIIAEADPFIARLLQRFAEESGLEVLSTQVGQDILALARDKKPSMIILDPELPGTLRGWDILRILHEDTLTQHIPVITCAWIDAETIRERTGWPCGNLHKPGIHYEDFVAVLKQAGISQDTPAS